MNAITNDTSPTENRNWTVDNLAESQVLPGINEAELPFALPFDVPNQIMEKLLAR